VTICALGASLLGLTACGSTPDGQISEIEGAINGAVLEAWSTTANDYVDIAVVADHNCELNDIYFVCLQPGDVLGRTDIPATTARALKRSPSRTTSRTPRPQDRTTTLFAHRRDRRDARCPN
jgi:hypothetical protein